MEFEFDQRLISSYQHSDDAEGEPGIRPLFLDQYIGQTKVKDNMNIFIEAAKLRSEALDHVLLYGSPGLGKTTLANIIANELGVHIHITSGPALEQPKDLLPIITKFMPNSVLFIDEIHRLNRTVEEMLYPVMEDFKYDYIMGKGPSASIINISLPRFTLIGATTRAGMLSSPLRNRFGVICRLEYYTVEELIQIVERAGRLLKILIDYDGAVEVARRSRGTPRIANRLLRRLRDIAQVRGKGVITKELAVEGLELLDIDQQGLDRVDIKVMEAIIYKFGGGPVGLETIAATISESADTIEDVCEPYLLQLGFLNRTPRGRQASPEAYRYFNLQPPGNLAGQGDIFS